MKICSRCVVRKKNQDFNKQAANLGGLGSYCKSCLADYQRLRRYGVEVKDYERLKRKQRNKCAICSTHLEKPVVDHNHESGMVRGLLCGPCNIGIGQLKDSLLFTLAAATYLARDIMGEKK